MTILLEDVLRIDPELLDDYKAHFASSNGSEEPLDVWVRDPHSWQGWQEYRPVRNSFNRTYIFSLMRFHPEANIWLFGGVWIITERLAGAYAVRLTSEFSAFIGRLKIRYPYSDRARRVNLEKHFCHMEVSEILSEPYGGRPFPGFDGIDLSFVELETIISKDRPDWKQALANAKGVYLITDVSTRKRYIGSAYGDTGIWSRWSQYVYSGHGGNVHLRSLIPGIDLTYCRKNFRFNLLEYHLPRALDQYVIGRESYWKEVLSTRIPHGLNGN